MFTLERNAGALYEQIEYSIIKCIASGVFKANDQLPSVRSMAKELNVNPNTVQRAYNNLESKGIIYTLVGKGVFVNSKREGIDKITEMAKLKLESAIIDVKKAGMSLEDVISEVKKIYVNI